MVIIITIIIDIIKTALLVCMCTFFLLLLALQLASGLLSLHVNKLNSIKLELHLN
jgi:hypothetical protein